MNSFFSVAGAWNERPNGSERVRTDVGLGQGALGDPFRVRTDVGLVRGPVSGPNGRGTGQGALGER